MTKTQANIDPSEVAKFSSVASRWWDPEGEFKPLHAINPLRLAYIERYAPLAGKKVLDVGCGGGLLSEAMAGHGAEVTGIDVVPASLSVAKLHLLESGAKVDYREITVEDLADEAPGSFDVITCMEMLEHVPDPASVIAACARLAKPDGQVFFSTINRNPKAYLFAVVGAEYVLNMLPKGTHDYQKFIRPAELESWSRAAGLAIQNFAGITYNPLTRRFSLDDDIDVNYMAYATPTEQ